MKKVTKLKSTDNPIFGAGDPDFFKYGADNPDVSLPVDYTVILDTDVIPVVGQPFVAPRIVRNGEPSYGHFNTSIVFEVIQTDAKIIFKTMNSVYEMTNV